MSQDAYPVTDLTITASDGEIADKSGIRGRVTRGPAARMELHGMSQWASGGRRWDQPGEPEKACVVGGQIIDQADCTHCQRDGAE